MASVPVEEQGDAVPRAWREGLWELADVLGQRLPGGTRAVAGLGGSPDPDFADRVTAFVVDGASEELTDQLGLLRRVSAIMFARMRDRSEDAESRVWSLSERLPLLPADVGYRFLLVEHALRDPRSGRTALDLPSEAPLLLRVLNRADRPSQPLLTHAFLERLQAAAGWPPHTLLIALATAPALKGYEDGRAFQVACQAPDLAEALVRHSDRLRAALPAPIGVEGVQTARLLVAAPAAVVALSSLAADLLTSPVRATRTAALPLLHSADAAAVSGPLHEALSAMTAGGAPAVRALAYSALFEAATSRGDADRLARLRASAEADKAVTVRRLARRWTIAATVGTEEPAEVEPSVGTEIDWHIPLTAEIRAAVDRICGVATFADPTAVERVLAVLQDPSPAPDVPLVRWSERDRRPAFAAEARVLGPVALAKLTAFALRGEEWFHVVHQLGYDLLPACPAMPDLDAVASLLTPFSPAPTEMVSLYLHPHFDLGRVMPPEAAAEYFGRHPDVVIDQLRRRVGRFDGSERTRLFATIAAMPSMPGPLVTVLLEAAFGPVEEDRRPAQQALARVPDLGDRVSEALADGRAEVRAAAALWLGDLGDQAVVPLLRVAARAEKQDAARAAILAALEALGAAAWDLVDLDALEAEARKAAGKPVPPALAWLNWDDVPRVRWASGLGRDGREVPADVVRLVLVKAVKAKSAEPNAMLRGWCRAWDAADRGALAEWLFDGWLAADLVPVGPERARELAEADALYMLFVARTTPSHPWQGWTREQVVEALLPRTSRTPVGSATASKGVLAVAAACGTGRATFTPRVERYLTDWYGQRPAQCKALLAVLAWVDAPSATTLLLSVARRFRTASIQDEAGRLVLELAARKGWTVDELGDRTMSTAGLSDDGTLTLDYGPRQFTASLRADLTLGLRDPDGKELKALPAPRVSDDEELAAAAKKAMTSAKKQLTATVKQQTTRLEEALFTGRTWAFADWWQYLLGHPIVRHLVARLVWAQVDARGDVVVAFRPLDDGTLTDADDDPVDVPADARIVLAHDGLLGEAAVAAWVTHLADYQVTPPFPQLGGGWWELPTELAQEKELVEFRGHVVEAFALRGRATKLGWTRGTTEDGGRFFEYRRRFPSLRLEAALRFTGNQLPEENRPVALEALTVERLPDNGPSWGAAAVPLGDVPPVLLSRCRAEVAAIAAEGSGFDPGWERLAEF